MIKKVNWLMMFGTAQKALHNKHLFAGIWFLAVKECGQAMLFRHLLREQVYILLLRRRFSYV